MWTVFAVIIYSAKGDEMCLYICPYDGDRFWHAANISSPYKREGGPCIEWRNGNKTEKPIQFRITESDTKILGNLFMNKNEQEGEPYAEIDHSS